MEDNADRYEVVKTTYLSTELHKEVVVASIMVPDDFEC